MLIAKIVFCCTFGLISVLDIVLSILVMNNLEMEISFKIIGAAIEMHRVLGPGLLESAYEAALAHDLRELGLNISTQVPMPLVYKGIRQEVGFRIDLLVEDKVVVEIKSL